MPILLQKYITRPNLRSNPERRYVFGDNVKRIGSGPRSGQAGEMRGEPNAIGVVTKWEPNMEPRAFFSDSKECQDLMLLDLKRIDEALDDHREVVLPASYIGGGRAMMHVHAPRLHDWLMRWIENRSSR